MASGTITGGDLSSPKSLGITLSANQYPTYISFNDIKQGGAYWRNNNTRSQQTINIYLCDSAGNNRIYLFSVTAAADSSAVTPKEATITGATALAGKALYIVATGDTTYLQLRNNSSVTVNTATLNYSVSITAGTGGTATVSKASAAPGETITVVVNPSSGYKANTPTASGITFTNAGTNTWTFTMPSGNVSISATFSKINYTVSKTASPAAGGTVTLSKTTAQIGDEITITATPATGYRVKSIVTNPSRMITNNKFTMPASNVAVTVTFEKITYTITLSADAGSLVTVTGQAQYGDQVSISINAANGYRIKSTTTSPNVTISNGKFTMPASNLTITVTSEKVSYAVTKSISPSGGGTVSLSKTSATMDEQITITATPASGYKVKTITATANIYGGQNITITNNKFTMPAADVQVSVTFEKISYTVSKTVTPSGSGTVSLSKTSATIGDEITVTATPATGYKLKSIVTSPARTVTNNKFTMPAGNVTVTVTFEKISYTITKTVTPSGAGTVTTSKASANFGDTITVSQTPASGYYFDGWETTPANLISSGQFTMPAQNVTVKAKYLKRSTASVNTKTLTSNGTVRLTISPDNAAYRHKYKLSFGTGMDSGWVSVAANTTEINISVPDSWAAAIPNATSKSGGTLQVQTYKSNNTTLIGTYEITGFTYNVRSGLVPTLSDITKSIARTIGGTTYANVGSYYVQGKCGVRIQATAAGVQSSTITKIECTLSGYSGSSYNKTVNNNTSLDYTTGLLNIKGTITITVKATDSRGRTATKTTTITVTAYTKPSGTLNVYRVDSGGQTDVLGTYAKYSKTNTYTQVGSNSLTVTLISQNVQASNPAASGDLLPNNRQTFDRLTEYNIQLKLQDAFETVYVTKKLPTARFIIYVDHNGDRMAFMKAANTALSKNGKDTVLEFADTAQMYIGAEMLEEYVAHNLVAKQLGSGDDANTLPGGIYYVSTNVSNVPSDYGCLICGRRNAGQAVFQLFISNAGTGGIFYRDYTGNPASWHTWKKIIGSSTEERTLTTVNYGETSYVKYWKSGDTVTVFVSYKESDGDIGTWDAKTIATLPAGFRPANQVWAAAVNDRGADDGTYIYVGTDGAVKIGTRYNQFNTSGGVANGSICFGAAN